MSDLRALAIEALRAAGVTRERRVAVVVIIESTGPRIAERDAYARSVSRRDPSLAFILSHERVAPGAVLVVRRGRTLEDADVSTVHVDARAGT